jgi:hypothetical protein
MRVFISWSGQPSRSIARALDGWLESVVQAVDVWMSDEEIASGQRWSEVIAKSLDETDFGIVCVTQANQHQPWLIFEAGALAKSVTEGRVVPLCIDLLSTDITGPLVAFQGRSLDEDGMRRLVHDLNIATERQMPKELLDGLFSAMWPKLKAAIDEALAGASSTPTPQRRSEDMLAEIVDGLRRIERGLGSYLWTGTRPYRVQDLAVVENPSRARKLRSAESQTIVVMGLDEPEPSSQTPPEGAAEPQPPISDDD